MVKVPAATASLPIDAHLDAISAAMETHDTLILSAEPGAGKTTRVPLALLRRPWCQGQRLLLLEPRRAAARLAAQRMAEALGEAVGQTVGYRTRDDSRVGRHTRLEVVTEGVFSRLLLEDPALEGYAGVLFDEVHERNLSADMALALTLHSRELLRPDLRLVLMSATLDTRALLQLVPEAANISVPAPRHWPVALDYRAPASGQHWLEHMARVVRDCAHSASGAVLAFLPGAAEIERLARMLTDLERLGIDVLPLHSRLPLAQQQQALTVPEAGGARVILATNLAESSLTIGDVETVVDSGLRRRPQFDPGTGLSRLETRHISMHSAVQRCGRAGRTGPGRCVRLWSASQVMAEADSPEICAADLAGLVLDLGRLGIADPQELRWLTPPPAPAWQAGQRLLRQFGAIDAEGRLTAHGKALQALPLAPRLGQLVLRARAAGCGALGHALAAILDGGPYPDDLEQAMARLMRGDERHSPAARLYDRLQRMVGRGGAAAQEHVIPGWLMASAWPDRVAMRRAEGDQRYLLANGRGAVLPASSPLRGQTLLVVDDLSDGQPEARIRHAWPVTMRDLERAGLAIEHDGLEHYWDPSGGRVRARRVTRLGALALSTQEGAAPDPAAAGALMLQRLQQDWQRMLPWSEAVQQWRARVACMRAVEGTDWPDVSDAGLQASMERWLLPWLAGIHAEADLAKLPLLDMLKTQLTPAQQQRLQRALPERISVPSGRAVTLDYTAPTGPRLAVKLQEMFGVEQLPALASGAIAITAELLSPAGRPLALTSDLASFWRNAYPQVRAEMRGRYPKHRWPEDPLSADPGSTTKTRK